MPKLRPSILYVPKRLLEGGFSDEYLEYIKKTLKGKGAWGYIPVFDNKENLTENFPGTQFLKIDGNEFEKPVTDHKPAPEIEKS